MRMLLARAQSVENLVSCYSMIINVPVKLDGGTFDFNRRASRALLKVTAEAPRWPLISSRKLIALPGQSMSIIVVLIYLCGGTLLTRVAHRGRGGQV